MATKKKAVIGKVKRIRFYGLVKPKSGQKLAWVSRQNKHGWSLGLIVGKRTIWLRNVRFVNEAEVVRATKDLSVAFMHLAGVE